MIDLTQAHIELERYGIRVVLNADAIVPHNPGEDTPCMVYRDQGRLREKYSATYWCAIGTGELSGRDGDHQIPGAPFDWLLRLEGEIGDWLEAWTARIEAQTKEGA